MKRRELLALGFAGAAGSIARDARASDVIAIEHARVHPGNGTRLDDATIVIAGGRIAAVGANVAVPAGARRIEASGTWVTPGLFDAESQTGLVDVQLEPTTVETGLDERYDLVRAAFRVVDGWNPRSAVVPITRMEGVTAAALAPHRGFVSGQGAVVRFAPAGIVTRAPSAVYVSVAGEGRAAAFGARGGALLRLREVLDDARTLARRRGEFERNDLRRLAAGRLDLEALIPVTEGKLPIVVEAHRASDLEAVLRVAAEEKLRLVLSGADEGHLVAAAIAAAKVPVIVTPTSDLPRTFESLAARLDNAARLHAAGVELALSPREREDHSSRTLRVEAGNAVAHGLPWEVALAGVTSVPARIFGAADAIGTIAVGRAADLVVWTGDPFEPLSRVRHVFVAGEELALRSRQTELRDRYRRRGGASPAR